MNGIDFPLCKRGTEGDFREDENVREKFSD
jgi:hypothetical protein